MWALPVLLITGGSLKLLLAMWSPTYYYCHWGKKKKRSPQDEDDGAGDDCLERGGVEMVRGGGMEGSGGPPPPSHRPYQLAPSTTTTQEEDEEEKESNRSTYDSVPIPWWLSVSILVVVMTSFAYLGIAHPLPPHSSPMLHVFLTLLVVGISVYGGGQVGKLQKKGGRMDEGGRRIH